MCMWEHVGVAEALLELIVSDPAVLNGQPRIRGTRIPVTVLLDCLAAGMTGEEISREYPTLPEGSIRAALAYAAQLAHEELLPLEPTPG